MSAPCSRESGYLPKNKGGFCIDKIKFSNTLPSFVNEYRDIYLKKIAFGSLLLLKSIKLNSRAPSQILANFIVQDLNGFTLSNSNSKFLNTLDGFLTTERQYSFGTITRTWMACFLDMLLDFLPCHPPPYDCYWSLEFPV